MHVPKCGSVFATQVIQTQCPEIKIKRAVLNPDAFFNNPKKILGVIIASFA